MSTNERTAKHPSNGDLTDVEIRQKINRLSQIIITKEAKPHPSSRAIRSSDTPSIIQAGQDATRIYTLNQFLYNHPRLIPLAQIVAHVRAENNKGSERLR